MSNLTITISTDQPAETSPTISDTFRFGDSTIRIITIDGEPWFAVADVCDVLGYANSRDALAKHCRTPGVAKRDMGVVTGFKADGTPAIQQVPTTFINEGNLYRLIIKSRKPEAEKFESWVCDEVLPTIRKTGGYSKHDPAPKLGETGHWLASQYAQYASRYLTRSGQEVSAALRKGIEARMGVSVRDVPASRLGEMMDEMEAFSDDCYRLWRVCDQLEKWLLAKWKQAPCDMPEAITALMACVNVPQGDETVLVQIRKQAAQLRFESGNQPNGVSIH